MINMSTRLLLLSLRYRQQTLGKTNHNPDDTAGFTLIELLVVIIIIGILAAVALPTMLDQANKAQQAGVKTHLGAYNRAQQAYYFENGNFSSTVSNLGLGIPEETKYHSYAVSEAQSLWMTVEANPKGDLVKGYLGLAYIDGFAIQTRLCDGTRGNVPSVALSLASTGVVVDNCDSSM